MMMRWKPGPADLQHHLGPSTWQPYVLRPLPCARRRCTGGRPSTNPITSDEGTEIVSSPTMVGEPEYQPSLTPAGIPGGWWYCFQREMGLACRKCGSGPPPGQIPMPAPSYLISESGDRQYTAVKRKKHHSPISNFPL